MNVPTRGPVQVADLHGKASIRALAFTVLRQQAKNQSKNGGEATAGKKGEVRSEQAPVSNAAIDRERARWSLPAQ